jgi:hypothetical protein
MAKFGGGASGNMYKYYADLADDFPFVERHQPSMGGEVALLVREPVGVVGAIVPWNSPTSAAAMKVAPALIAGCTVVLKASPEAPSAMYVLGRNGSPNRLAFRRAINCLTRIARSLNCSCAIRVSTRSLSRARRLPVVASHRSAVSEWLATRSSSEASPQG